MIARIKPTRRLTLASLFTALALLGGLGATVFGCESYLTLESENWYLALLYFGAAELSLGIGAVALIKLLPYRPEEAIPAAWRQRFRANRTPREKFRAYLVGYSILLAVVCVWAVLFLVLFPKAAALAQGERVQFLVLSSLVSSFCGCSLFYFLRTLVRQVPDDDEGSRPSPQARGGPALRLVKGFSGGALIAFGFGLMGVAGKQMYAIWGGPALGTSDYLVAVGAMMVASAYCLYIGMACVAPRRRATPVGGDSLPTATNSDATGEGPVV